MPDRNLRVCHVAEIANCHVNTVRAYERKGYIKAMRDNNNFRWFTLQDAIKLKKILNIRKSDK
jgi:DNA-binding transcriptional MerR regulator